MSIDVEASTSPSQNQSAPATGSISMAKRLSAEGRLARLEPSQPRILRKYPKLRLATHHSKNAKSRRQSGRLLWMFLEHFREIGWMSWWLSNLHWSFLPTAASISCYFLISSYNLVASWSWLHWRLLPLMAMLIALGSTLALVPGIRAPACLGRLQRQRLQRQVIPKCIPQLANSQSPAQEEPRQFRRSWDRQDGDPGYIYIFLHRINKYNILIYMCIYICVVYIYICLYMHVCVLYVLCMCIKYI